jgi:peptide-methionine (S)-S-oxide reductase
MSIVFYHDEVQKRLAMETKARQEVRAGSQVYTEIVPYTEFYLAEDYHQKYRLRQAPEVMEEFSAMYADKSDFVASTAAARVNGYVSGNGDLATLQEELDRYGLSTAGREKLMRIAEGFLGQPDGQVC